MKLSENTLKVLKNFSEINAGIIFKEGNVVRVISPNKTILAKATVEDSFDRDFAIYDMSRFISVLSLFSDPEIKLGKDAVTIVSDKQKLVYVYADATSIVAAPTKDFKLDNPDVSLKITAADLKAVKRAGEVLQLPEISIVGDGKNPIKMMASNSKNPTSDGFSIEVSDDDSVCVKKFNIIFKAENLKMIPNDYDLDVSSLRVGRFHKDDLTYWIALEADSVLS